MKQPFHMIRFVFFVSILVSSIVAVNPESTCQELISNNRRQSNLIYFLIFKNVHCKRKFTELSSQDDYKFNQKIRNEILAINSNISQIYQKYLEEKNQRLADQLSLLARLEKLENEYKEHVKTIYGEVQTASRNLNGNDEWTFTFLRKVMYELDDLKLLLSDILGEEET